MSYYEYNTTQRYVQYPGAFQELMRYACLSGKRILILLGAGPANAWIRERIQQGASVPVRAGMNEELLRRNVRYARYAAMAQRLEGLRGAISYDFYDINGLHVCENNVRALADYVQEHGYDTVVGVGGGRGMDLARAITRFADVKVLLAPTLAATNASISTLSVIYSEDGSRVCDYWRMDNAPELVLVDTDIIRGNSPQILAAGIGDIMATYHEALVNVNLSQSRDAFSALSYEGVELAIRIMMRDAPKALKALRTEDHGAEFESVVSMIMYNCGPLWSICTTGLAHVLDEVFLYFEQAHCVSHGLRVGFATIPMLKYAGWGSDALAQYMAFCKAVGIPTSLEELRLEGVSRKQWTNAAQSTVMARGALQGLPFDIDFEALLECVLQH